MEYLASPLGWKNILLIISAFLNLGMSIFVLVRGIKSKINIYFSLLTFCTFLWGLSVFFGRVLTIPQWQFWAYFAYIAALGIGVSLFYFTLYFPYKVKNLRILHNLLILIPAIVLSVVVYIKDWFVVRAVQDIYSTYTLYHYKPVYLIYAIYFICIILIALYFLWIKYRKSEGIVKKQLGFLSLAILIGLIVGAYYDLIICYFANFKHIWLGPVFTLLMNAAAFHLIFFKKKQ